MIINKNFLRPSNYLIEYNKLYPQAWKNIDEYIQKYHAHWPSWCFIPMNANVLDLPLDTDAAILGAFENLNFLSAWRATQGVYRFDADVLEPLWDTDVSGEIPVDVLFRLPEWCVYIETGKRAMGFERTLHGFFACVDFGLGDPKEFSENIVIFLDIEHGLNSDNFLFPLCFPLKITSGIFPTIQELIDLYMDNTGNQFFPADPSVFADPIVRSTIQNDLKQFLPRIFSLLIYLCSENSELRSNCGKNYPSKNISPKRTKNGVRYFPPDKPAVWDTAWRVGASIRSYRENASRTNEHAPGVKKRPHIRRAHWHSYWVGSLSDRSVRLKWLPPIPVNVDSPDNLVPVVRGC